jgi:hypothetical protein
MTKRSLLSKTGETTDSKIGTDTHPKDQGNAAINSTPEKEITGTKMGSTASNAKSKTTLRKNAGSELKTINCARTNKDVPIGLKCM